MSGNRVLAILLAVAAGGFVYPLAAQQGPTTTQSTPAPAAPAAAGPQSAPQPQPDASVIPPFERPQARPGAPAPPAGQAPSAPGRRAFSPPAPGGMVSLNFNRADLVEIIHIIAQQLRLTYTIDPEVKGTVTINSAEPLRPEDLLPVFHQLLRMNGAVAVRTGNLYHIMPIKDGKGLARPIGQSREDSFAVQIIPVRFFSVSEMKKVLTPFLQPGAELVENPRGNFLIVMDLPSNIQRLMEIADLIDVQVFAGTRMEIYQPKVASAEELSQEMTKVMQSFAASTPQTENFTAQFIPLPRINQLLVISHSEAAWTYARRWLDRIDIVAEPGRRIFIYPVENGKATELADVLSQALGQSSTGSKTSSQTLQSLHRSTPGGTSQQQGSSGNPPSSFQPRTTTGSAFATIPVPGQIAPPPTVTPQPQATPPGVPGVPRPTIQSAPGSAQQQEQVRIVADPATNSLIIFGSAHEFQNIKNILRDLDAVPRQVLIEAMILQVDLNDTKSFGVDYEIFRGSRTIFGDTFSSRGALRTLGDLFPVAPGFGASSGLSGIVGGQDLRAMIRALMTDSRVKLISSPSVLAADNRPARIQVGSEEPIATGTIAQAVGGVAQSTSIQYRNTGRILTIIPQVNSKGLVNLQIKAEVSARGDDVQVGADTFPAFNTQDAETTAVVQDGETLVIGGLIGERKSRGRTGIPYLMDIPVIGRFFGTTNDESNRTELIMLITPRVIRNFDEARNVTAEFKSKVSTVRTELERIERDREKSQPKPRPEELPPMPVPPANYPQAPNAAPNQLPPADRGAAAIAPFAGNVTTVQPNGAPRQAGIDSPSSVRQPIAATNEPAYALSIVKQNVETPKIAVAKPAEAISAKPTEPVAKVTPARTWTVQVAAVAVLKDAERLAGQLRIDGYEAYVVTAQLDSKTWHRVRVGQLERLKEALELKKALANNRQFRDPYVAAR
jgi:general secretion pathway protein D